MWPGCCFANTTAHSHIISCNSNCLEQYGEGRKTAKRRTKAIIIIPSMQKKNSMEFKSQIAGWWADRAVVRYALLHKKETRKKTNKTDSDQRRESVSGCSLSKRIAKCAENQFDTQTQRKRATVVEAALKCFDAFSEKF